MQEKKAWALNGFVGILLVLLWFAIGGFIGATSDGVGGPIVAIVFLFLGILSLSGLQIVQPNQGYVVMFFGRYLGSLREDGFWWTIPFSSRKKVSMRVRNFHTNQLKVNDVDGNPIEIAAVIVFNVVDSAKAMFDVDNYERFVEIQSEIALRHIASYYPYDNLDDKGGFTLRANADEVAEQLQLDLQNRLAIAGVKVLEARLTHLAYSAEIAHAMLQRQQASAILAARALIVEGAVGMVKMAIQKLQAEGVVELDEERKAAMINNLMVSIVSDRGTQPIVNAGSLY
ncbi:SPFH domain-containing protein [Tumebacillus permanentifrigoris]|uniref:Regulator of protease activity HflC (Stomatin/prohibitin superfamily) n=1 Tax=Tumebacillus permanentifrigoris TaxID=378543 RepID=A0A316DVS4_9BACL|nr:SPFH domain-containing protein [Tumebacillus permanentifrigoris]PWK13445.1 regulator of protease activity HflC (stomatin/prohibitin superfamily) [Tumebacillus permanentifrigoris]